MTSDILFSSNRWQRSGKTHGAPRVTLTQVTELVSTHMLTSMTHIQKLLYIPGFPNLLLPLIAIISIPWVYSKKPRRRHRLHYFQRWHIILSIIHMITYSKSNTLILSENSVMDTPPVTPEQSSSACWSKSRNALSGDSAVTRQIWIWTNFENGPIF